MALTEEFQADLEARHQAAKERGDEVEFISAAKARELAPTFHPPENCRILMIPRDGYAEPKSVAVAYAAAARDRGARIHTNVEVTSLIRKNGRVSGVRTNSGDIEANWVVLAAGAWTRRFGQREGLQLCTVPVRHQALVTAPMDGVLPNQPIIRITEPQIYARHEAGGLLVGGYGYRPLSVDMKDFPENFEMAALAPDAIYYKQLRDAAQPFFPCLSDAVIIQQRRGLPTISPDGRLIVSQPLQMKGLIIVSACGVGGIDRSPGIGRVVADIVTGRTPWIDPQILGADRFGDGYREEDSLRARCEQVYSRHYHEVY